MNGNKRKYTFVLDVGLYRVLVHLSKFCGISIDDLVRLLLLHSIPVFAGFLNVYVNASDDLNEDDDVVVPIDDLNLGFVKKGSVKKGYAGYV